MRSRSPRILRGIRFLPTLIPLIRIVLRVVRIVIFIFSDFDFSESNEEKDKSTAKNKEKNESKIDQENKSKTGENSISPKAWEKSTSLHHKKVDLTPMKLNHPHSIFPKDFQSPKLDSIEPVSSMMPTSCILGQNMPVIPPSLNYVTSTKQCNVMVQRNLPPKLDDPGSFTIPCIIRIVFVLMPYVIQVLTLI